MKVIEGGGGRKIIKVHSELRNTLFTPSCEEAVDYAVHNSELQALRVTIGVTKSGRHFQIEDNWKTRANRELAEPWTGKTIFILKASAKSIRTSSHTIRCSGAGTSSRPALASSLTTHDFERRDIERPSRTGRCEEEYKRLAENSPSVMTGCHPDGRLLGMSGTSRVASPDRCANNNGDGLNFGSRNKRCDLSGALYSTTHRPLGFVHGSAAIGLKTVCCLRNQRAIARELPDSKHSPLSDTTKS